MTDQNFIDGCKRTESTQCNINHDDTIRLLHAGMGLATESAEFIDAIKKHIFYGKELDTTNLKEEMGDILWYMAIAMDVLDTDFDTEQQRVIEKLKVRYPEKFTDYHAENRDLDAERKVLEHEPHPNQGSFDLSEDE